MMRPALALALALTSATAAHACGGPAFPSATDLLALAVVFLSVPIGLVMIPMLAARAHGRRSHSARGTRGRVAAAGLALLWPLTMGSDPFWGLVGYAIAFLAFIYLMVPLVVLQPRARGLALVTASAWALHLGSFVRIETSTLWDLTALVHLAVAALPWPELELSPAL